jgi:hypothetical protein
MRYLVGFICVIMLAVAGCGEETIPCKERTDCGALVKVDGYYVLADDRCTPVYCTNRVCSFRSLDCQGKYMTNFGCRRVEFIECNPDAEDVCGTLTAINEGRGCPLSNCTNQICRDGDCSCEGWCICGL